MGLNLPKSRGGGGGGGVSGLSTADGGTALADNVIVRGDGTTGIQGSALYLTDAGIVTPTLSGFTTGLKVTGNHLVSVSVNNGSQSGTNQNGLLAGNVIAEISGGTGGSGTLAMIAQTKLFKAVSGGQYTWVSSATNAKDGTADTGLARQAAGVLRSTDGSTSTGAFLSTVLVEANTAVAAGPNVIAATESGTTFTNEGATALNVHTLPTAVAGLRFRFICQDSDGIQVNASTGDTIRDATGVSSAGGTATLANVGDVMELECINATEWFVVSGRGTAPTLA